VRPDEAPRAVLDPVTVAEHALRALECGEPADGIDRRVGIGALGDEPIARDLGRVGVLVFILFLRRRAVGGGVPDAAGEQREQGNGGEKRQESSHRPASGVVRMQSFPGRQSRVTTGATKSGAAASAPARWAIVVVKAGRETNVSKPRSIRADS